MSDVFDPITDVLGTVGPPGPAAAVGALFSFQGTLDSSEPPLTQVMPTAGVFSQANSIGNADVAPTADAAFTLAIDGVGAGSVVFHAGQKVPVITLTTTAYAKGSLVKLIPPAVADLTLSGPSVALLN